MEGRDGELEPLCKASLVVIVASPMSILPQVGVRLSRLRAALCRANPSWVGGGLWGLRCDILSMIEVEVTDVEVTDVEVTDVEVTDVEVTDVEVTDVEVTKVEVTG